MIRVEDPVTGDSTNKHLGVFFTQAEAFKAQLTALLGPRRAAATMCVSRGPTNPYPGVHIRGPSKFKATIKLPGSKRVTHLRYFETPQAANEAFEAARVAREDAA